MWQVQDMQDSYITWHAKPQTLNSVAIQLRLAAMRTLRGPWVLITCFVTYSCASSKVLGRGLVFYTASHITLRYTGLIIGR